MSKKILFLDIDWVLHPNGTVSLLVSGSVSGPGPLFRWLDIFERRMQEHSDVSVVVHSTWRLLWETDQELKTQLPAIFARRIWSHPARRDGEVCQRPSLLRESQRAAVRHFG